LFSIALKILQFVVVPFFPGIADICGMHILLLAATEMEIQPAIDLLDKAEQKVNGHSIEVLISGIGILNTTYTLAKSIDTRRPDFVLQAGIGGSFNEQYPPGSIAIIGSEIVGDLGVTEQTGFADVFDMHFQLPDQFPYTNKRLLNNEYHADNKWQMPVAAGITVNMISTGADRIAMLRKKYAPDMESMEGAALHYVCLRENIRFLQLRSVSNFAGERNKANWKIREAIEGLNNALFQILNDLT
jgi:futalosine hydrolase